MARDNIEVPPLPPGKRTNYSSQSYVGSGGLANLGTGGSGGARSSNGQGPKIALYYWGKGNVVSLSVCESSRHRTVWRTDLKIGMTLIKWNSPCVTWHMTSWCQVTTHNEFWGTLPKDSISRLEEISKRLTFTLHTARKCMLALIAPDVCRKRGITNPPHTVSLQHPWVVTVGNPTTTLPSPEKRWVYRLVAVLPSKQTIPRGCVKYRGVFIVNMIVHEKQMDKFIKNNFQD